MVIPELDLGKTVASYKKLVISTTVSGAIIQLDKIGVIDKFGDDVKAALPRAVSVHGITEEFKASFLSLISQGFLPEGYFGHFTHLDHVVLSEGFNVLIEMAKDAGYSDKLRRFGITLATSVRGGQQSQFLRAIYSKMESYVNERNTDFLEITRADKDVERYGMKSKISEKRALLYVLRQEDVGIAIPAGDSVEPGRHPKGATGDRINGLQQIKDTDLVDLYVTMERYRPTFFQPMAVIGTWRFFSSDSLLPTPEALAYFYQGRQLSIAWLFELDLNRAFSFLAISPDISIDIIFGMPIPPEEIVSNLGSNWRKDPQDVNLFLMTRQASLLPDYAKGYYRPFVQKELSKA